MSKTAGLETELAAALTRAGFSGTTRMLLVGISGGPDSSALLHCLTRLRQHDSFGLHAAHLNHDFRGAEADDDAEHAAAFARDLGVPATVEKWDPLEFQRDNPERRNSSFEHLAREMRYSFLAKTAKTVGAAAVVVAHTADDQAETVLLHLLRGSGLHGIAGMSELAPWPWPAEGLGLFLFRPLLAVSKQDTAAYCHQAGITYREDSGNSLPRFTRVRLRRELIPRLEAEYNPKVKDSLLRLARTAAIQLDYVEREVSRVWPQLAQDADGAIYVDLERFGAIDPALQALVLRRAYQGVKGDTRRLEETHLRHLVTTALEGRSGQAIELPQGVKAHRTYYHLVFFHGDRLPCPLPPLNGEYVVEIPVNPNETATTLISGWRVTTGYSEPDGAGGTAEFDSPTEQQILWRGQRWTVPLDAEVLSGGLTIRSRQPGDRWQPHGMDRQKKLQDYFTDAHTPRSWRDRVPLLVTPQGIAAVAGHRASQWAQNRGHSISTEATVWVTIQLDMQP